MTTSSPELALIAACCRWPPSPARNAAVRTAAGGVDWARVERLAARHRVPALIVAGLTTAKVALPADRAPAWLRSVAQIAQRSALLAAQSAALQILFDTHGIPALVVKGAPLAMLAYGTLDLKHAKDIDLLVAPGDVPAVIALLQAEGYRLWHPATILSATQLRDVIRHDREIEMVHDGPARLQIELHWALSRNRRTLPQLDAHAPTQRIELGAGRGVRTLQQDDLFAYLCVHGASHGWFRLKWLADLAAFAGSRDVEHLYRAAQARGVAASAGQALLLAHELLALDLAPALATELRGSAQVRRLLRVAHALIADDARHVSRWRLLQAQWLLTRDRHDVRANLAQAMIATGDVLAVPLPPRLHFLYPLLRAPLGVARLARRRRSARRDQA